MNLISLDYFGNKNETEFFMQAHPSVVAQSSGILDIFLAAAELISGLLC